MKWLVVLLLGAGAAGLGQKLWPDIARYIKIREM